MAQLMAIVQADPAVNNVVGFTGGGSGGGRSSTNTGSVFVSLKPLSQRTASADEVINRLRRKLGAIAGAHLFLQAVQDISVGGRQSNAQFQYTLQGETPEELNQWTPKLVAALQKSKILTDVSSDLQQAGLETVVQIDRDTASRLHITPVQIDNTLYDAFGQRQVSTIYSAVNQYHVVMEVAPRYWQDPETLKGIYVSTSGGNPSGTQITALPAGTAAVSVPPVGSVSTAASQRRVCNNQHGARRFDQAHRSNRARWHLRRFAGVPQMSKPWCRSSPSRISRRAHTPLAVNHRVCLFRRPYLFNLAPGDSLGDATR